MSCILTAHLRPLTVRNLCSTGNGSVNVIWERSFCLKNVLRLHRNARPCWHAPRGTMQQSLLWKCHKEDSLSPACAR